MITKQGSQQVYNTIHKCREWLIPNCVVNTIGRVLSTFYIFRGGGICMMTINQKL